ncbi:MAG TPA: lipoxygenase family protein [Acidimicrobiales bacterium]|nr:lipoxygenase family protein [Acidimicrobiales bacterium]
MPTKFRANLPRQAPEPTEDERRVVPIPLQKRYPAIPITKIPVADHVPPDETMRARLLFCRVQAFLYRRFPPTQDGLPPIHPDPHVALDEAYTKRHRKVFRRPELPAEYVEPIDLGYLAVAGPYACYLQACEDGYEWDFRFLGGYEHHPELRSLACRVLFRADEDAQRLSAVEIDCEVGVCRPGDPTWTEARRIALGAATNHLSLVRHFNWVHLVTVANFAMVTRNNLSADHPVRRLLWPHMWGTQYSNELVTEILLMKGGDFESVFSFTHSGLWRLFEDSYAQYDIRVLDPTADAERRGILKGGFALPYLENRQAHHDVFHSHAQRWLRLSYDSDEALRADGSMRAWLDELERFIPGGVRGLLGNDVTIDGVARLTAGFIYLGSVEHEVLGTGLWDYQVWPHVQPTRIYRSGRRESVDVYQRLVNYNFILNVRRSPLLADFSDMARDQAGKEAFRTFLADLQALQERLDAEDPACWKVSPRLLESGVNG